LSYQYAFILADYLVEGFERWISGIIEKQQKGSRCEDMAGRRSSAPSNAQDCIYRRRGERKTPRLAGDGASGRAVLRQPLTARGV